MKQPRRLFLVPLASLLLEGVLSTPSDSTLLNHAAIVMTHNSATGEDGFSAILGDGQQVNMAQQLDCGARAFDYRPEVRSSDGAVVAHHGLVTVNVLMSQSIGSVISWLGNNQDELVVLYLSYFKGANAPDAAEAVLTSDLNLNTTQIVRDDCTQLAGLTIGDVKARSALPGGGYLFVVFGCVNEQYDASLTIGAGEPALFNYMASKSYFPSVNTITDGGLWMVQAHWQYGSFPDNPVGNEISTNLNAKVAQKISDNAYGFLNFVEVDNVCNGNGAPLKQAVDDFNSGGPQTTVSNCLSSDRVLNAGEYLESANGQFRARLDLDGRFCIYNADNMATTQWCEGGTGAPTQDGGTGVLKMQLDGNAVLYTPASVPYWNSGTSGSDQVYMKLQNDRHLVIYEGTNPLWACAFADPNNACVYVTGSACDVLQCASDTSCVTSTLTTTPLPTTTTTSTTAECSVNSDCDDGDYCNGAETCVGGSCKSGGEPCPGQTCDEAADSCVGSPLDLILSEIFPNPGNDMSDGNGEFIEFYNPTSSTIVLDAAADYEVCDSHSPRCSVLNGSVGPGEYFVLCRNAAYYGLSVCDQDTNIALRNKNGGETVSLTKNGGDLIDEVSYSSANGANTDKSLARDGADPSGRCAPACWGWGDTTLGYGPF